MGDERDRGVRVVSGREREGQEIRMRVMGDERKTRRGREG